MAIISYIFYLGIVFITFHMIWTLFLFLVNAVSGAKQTNAIVDNLLKILSYYLLAALSALKTLQYMNQETGASKYAFAVIGALVLYFYITGKIKKKAMRMSVNQTQIDLQTFKKVRYETFYLFAAVALFIVNLVYPKIATNAVTEWIYSAINTIYDWPIIGWIVGFLGIFFLLRMIGNGFTITNLILAWITRIFSGKPRKDDGFTEHEIIEDAEILEEEDNRDNRKHLNPKQD